MSLREEESMMRKYQLELPVVLDEHATSEKGRELARHALLAVQVEQNIEAEKDEAKRRIKNMREELTSVGDRIRQLARAVRKGEVIQAVDVEARVADDNSKVVVVRLDTGEVVETRALTEEDRQMQIDEVLAKIEADTKASSEKKQEEPEEEIEDDEPEEESAGEGDEDERADGGDDEGE